VNLIVNHEDYLLRLLITSSSSIIILVGKVKILRTNEDNDIESEEEKKLTIAADMN
jgi:hypothetical protein